MPKQNLSPFLSEHLICNHLCLAVPAFCPCLEKPLVAPGWGRGRCQNSTLALFLSLLLIFTCEIEVLAGHLGPSREESWGVQAPGPVKASTWAWWRGKEKCSRAEGKGRRGVCLDQKTSPSFLGCYMDLRWDRILNRKQKDSLLF